MERLSGGGGANAIDIICPFYDPLLPYSLALFPHLKRRVKLTIVRASVRFAARETKAIDRSAGRWLSNAPNKSERRAAQQRTIQVTCARKPFNLKFHCRHSFVVVVMSDSLRGNDSSDSERTHSAPEAWKWKWKRASGQI